MLKVYPIWILLLFLHSASLAQTNAVTITGKNVTLKNDGSWVYSGGLVNNTNTNNECELSEFGDVLFLNRTSDTAYVVIAKRTSEKFRIKIPPYKHKIVKSLKSVEPVHGEIEYSYKVFYNKEPNFIDFDKMATNYIGKFYIVICDTFAINLIK